MPSLSLSLSPGYKVHGSARFFCAQPTFSDYIEGSWVSHEFLCERGRRYNSRKHTLRAAATAFPYVHSHATSWGSQWACVCVCVCVCARVFSAVFLREWARLVLHAWPRVSSETSDALSFFLIVSEIFLYTSACGVVRIYMCVGWLVVVDCKWAWNEMVRRVRNFSLEKCFLFFFFLFFWEGNVFVIFFL